MALPESEGKDKAFAKGPGLAAFVTDSATEDTVKALLQEQVTTAPVVRRGSIAEAIEFLEKSASPDILIVDIAGVALPLSAVDRLMKACDPAVNVVVVGNSSDIGLFRSLLQVGVNDYLVKPLTVELLRRTIARFSGGADGGLLQTRTGKIITVTGSRGGAGASTVAVNLSWTLASAIGRKVVVVDLDQQFGTISMMVGARKSNNLTEALKYAHRIDNLLLDRLILQHTDKFHLLSAEEPLEQDSAIDFGRFELVCKALQERFHYVVIDLPRRPGDLYSKVLHLSQLTVIVATQTVTAVRDVLRIQRLLGREEMGRRAYVVVNHPAPPAPGEVSVKEFEEAVGRRIDYSIPYCKTAVASDNNGVAAIMESAPLNKVFLEFANDLSGKQATGRTSSRGLRRMFGG